MVWIYSFDCMITVAPWGMMFLEHRLPQRKDRTEWSLEISHLTLPFCRLSWNSREIICLRQFNWTGWIVTDLGLKLAMPSLSWLLTFGNCLSLLSPVWYVGWSHAHIDDLSCSWASVPWILHMQRVLLWPYFHTPSQGSSHHLTLMPLKYLSL